MNVIETILGFKALILAALIGGAYLVWRRSAVRRLREREHPPACPHEPEDAPCPENQEER